MVVFQLLKLMTDCYGAQIRAMDASHANDSVIAAIHASPEFAYDAAAGSPKTNTRGGRRGEGCNKVVYRVALCLVVVVV